MPDPLDRLTVAKAKIDELFGAGFAQQHPEVLVVVVQSAASDWAAARLASAWPSPSTSRSRSRSCTRVGWCAEP
jgi:hypothetical protein